MRLLNLNNTIIEFDELNDDLFYLEDELHNYVTKFKENLILSEKMRIEDDIDGLGISLVTSLATDYEYNQYNVYNCLTIKKKYDGKC